MSHANVGKKAAARFTPSRQDVAIYRALLAADRPLSTQDLIEQGCAAAATARHTCQWWTERGLLKRIFLDRIAWYEWAPAKRAEEWARALADAESIFEKTSPRRSVASAPTPAPTGASDPVAGALRAFAQLLLASADKLDGKG